ncbi:bifunctional nuclease family protein [Methanocalculus sp.]|uniref:bifunctional nuclease family protein n=1 Tax=Methanocalculus sp. TaxID=2004547 RepID=UPI0027222681|nr:bifunctional nuclease family protein [Methanocalculus sp.]MDO8840891.1 bifunctional nuclease family protein [Methanocalculus sp.]
MRLTTCQVLGVYLAVHDLGVAPVVLLEAPNHRYLPIFIGLYEAVSINNALNGPTPVRPLTHDLFNDTLLALETRLRDVRVDSIEDGVYYATMNLKTHLGDISIDCRPSDGIALAVRQKSPVILCDSILDDSAVSRDQLPELHDFIDYFG